MDRRDGRLVLLVSFLVGSLTPLAAEAQPLPGLRPSPRPTPIGSNPFHIPAVTWPRNETWSVIGRDDRVDVEGISHAGYDTRNFAEVGPCTATYIGGGRFLTAGHCFSPEMKNLRGLHPFPCDHQIEPWTLAPIPRDKCRVAGYAYEKGADWAVLEVDEDIARNLPMKGIPIDYAIDWEVVGERPIVVFGLSAGRLRFSDNGKARASQFSTGVVGVLHTADTDSGDSGSALIDQVSRRIIGIHAGRVVAVPSKHNYAFGIRQIAWSSIACSEVRTTAGQDLPPSGTLDLRVNEADDRARRVLTVMLKAQMPRADSLSVKLTGPADVEQPVLTRKSDVGRISFMLDEPGGLPAGTWRVRIQNGAQATWLYGADLVLCD